MMRVADTVAQRLHAHGIRHAFGMPGGEVVTLVDALQAAGISFHLARHETAAAIMAAGTSVVGGAPGLVVTTVGPGLANAVNGIADAAQEHVPLLVVSGIVDRPTRARYTHQVIDHAALLRPITKGSFEIEPESAGETVARALRLAMSEPRGPVHLDLSPAVAAMADPAPRPVRASPVLRPLARAEDTAIRAVADRLARAERPVILSGFDAARVGADLAGLAEALGAPVVTTYKGKGALPESHPLALGAAGLSPKADRILLSLLKASDLVLAIGYDPIEMRLGWLDPLADPEAFIDLVSAPVDHAMHDAGLTVVTDLASAVAALAATVRRAPRWPGGEPGRAKDALLAAFRDPGGFGPHAIVTALQAEAAPDDIVTVDSGAHRILLSQMWRAERPLTLLQSAGFCTMAAALPLAIGARVAAPDRRVFAVMGDGGLEMGLGELATLRDLGLPLTIVLFQDLSLALIAQKQAQAGLAPAGVALGATDFAAVAEAFGGVGRTVDDRESLAVELSAARGRDRFTLIACRFDADAYQNAF